MVQPAERRPTAGAERARRLARIQPVGCWVLELVKARRNGRTLYLSIPAAARRLLLLTPGAIFSCTLRGTQLVFSLLDPVELASGRARAVAHVARARRAK